VLALLVDTATAAITVGVVDFPVSTSTEPGVVVLAERVAVDARRHGEMLAPAVVEALAEAGVTPGELRAVVAGVGPGPFTGLRVGLVTAAALADALELPSYPVCTLDGVAAAAAGTGPLLVATDARRREVYWASYDAAGQRLHGPDVAKPAAVRAALDAGELGEGLTAVGSGAALYAEQLGLPVSGPLYPTVAGLAGLAARRVLDKAPSQPLTPLYLRRPDAVEPTARKPVLS
jgi:tRNA threonylcarbamoyl adenosine modification protein YeaZ